MKFILNEELTLDEKAGISNSGKKWSLSDDKLYAQMQKNGYTADEAEQQVNNILDDEEKSGSSARGYWDKKFNNKHGDNKEVTEEPTPETKQETVDSNEETTTRNNEESSQVGTSKDQLTGNEVADRLLKVIKKSNDNGYKAFLKGIKSNLKNNNFPFTKLMSNPKFSLALGIKEDLDEAGVFSTIVNKVKNPAIFSKFASVYNAILDLGNDKSNHLIDDPKSIIYDPNLYKMRDYKQIGPAIKIDSSGLEAGDTDKREEIKKAVASNKVDEVSEIKNSGSSKSSFDELKAKYDSWDQAKQKEFIKKLTGKEINW